MRRSRPGFGILLALASSFPALSLARGILAVDYGTQFMKLSLVQPGIPFDVLLNHDSKRKTQSVVSVRGEDKLVGDDAAALAGRFPQNSFASLKLLLGQPPESPSVKLHEALYRVPLESTSRGTVRFVPRIPQQGNHTVAHLPEELIALQFSYARELANGASAANPNAAVPGIGGEKISDCIITVPAFFNQFERKALLDGAELAGLRVLNLIDDGASVGVNFAMMRTFGSKKVESSLPNAGPGIETHVIYDVGASSIKATVIEFSMFEEKIHASSKVKKNVTMLEVRGYGYQRGLGGLTFDLQIRDHLKKDFEAQNKIDITHNDRAMTKLLREANRVKQVLSANAESQSRVEGLADDLDLKTSITRQEFEKYFASEVPKFTQPIIDALSSAQVDVENIKSVILVGGSSRVPMIQAAVKSLVGESKVAVSVNADEAAVMGSALYGAGISRQFKTKDIRIQTTAPTSISASYNVTRSPAASSPTEGSEDTRTVTTTLFDVKSRLGAKKTIKFRKADDFSVVLSHTNQPAYFPATLFNVTIHGITAALANHTNVTGQAISEKNATVKLSVQLDDSALLVVSSATLTFPSEVSPAPGEGTIANKIAGFFGSGKKKNGGEGESEEGVASEDDGEKAKPQDEKSELDKAKESIKSESAAGDETKKSVENVVVRLIVTVQELGIKPMSTHDRIASGKWLREMKAAETRKKNREEARNVLEAYTYKLRDRLEQEVFLSHSSEEEIKTVRTVRDETSDWLNDWAEQAPLKDLKEKKKALENAERPILQRITEGEERPVALKKFQATLQAAQLFQDTLNTTASSDTPPKYTAEEISSLQTFLQTQESWFEEMRSKVESLNKQQDPPVTVKEINSRGRTIDAEVQKLKLKKPPRKSPKSSGKPYSTKPQENAEKNATMSDTGTNNKTQPSEPAKSEPSKEEAKVETSEASPKADTSEGRAKDEL